MCMYSQLSYTIRLKGIDKRIKRKKECECGWYKREKDTRQKCKEAYLTSHSICHRGLVYNSLIGFKQNEGERAR